MSSSLELIKSVILSPSFGRRPSRDISNLFALSWLFGESPWPKGWESANKSHASRGVPSTGSGPRQGPTMTVLKVKSLRDTPRVYLRSL